MKPRSRGTGFVGEAPDLMPIRDRKMVSNQRTKAKRRRVGSMLTCSGGKPTTYGQLANIIHCGEDYAGRVGRLPAASRPKLNRSGSAPGSSSGSHWEDSPRSVPDYVEALIIPAGPP